MSASKYTRLFKNTGLFIEKLRKERFQENQDLREKRRSEELNKLRKLDDFVEENYFTDSIFDTHVIAGLCSDNEEIVLNSLKIYKNHLVANQNSTAASDLLALGTVSMISELFCRVNISLNLVHEILSIFAYLSSIDENSIDQWLNENILTQLHKICSISYESCASLLPNVLLILNIALRVSESVYSFCFRKKFVSVLLSLYQEITQLNGTFEIKKSLLMFFSFFYQYPIKSTDVSMAFFQICYYTFEGMFWRLVDLYNSSIENCKINDNIYTSYGSFIGNREIDSNFREVVLKDSNNKISNLIDLCDEMLFSLLCLTDDSHKHVDLLIQSNFLPLFKAIINIPLLNSMGCKQKSILRVFRTITSLIANVAKYGCDYTKELLSVGIVDTLWTTLFQYNCSYGVKISLKNCEPNDFDIDCLESRAYFGSTRHTLEVILKQDASTSVLLERNHLPYIINLLDNGPFSMRQEAVWALHIILQNGSNEVISYVVKYGAIMQLCDMLTVMDIESVLCSMECLSIILTHGEAQKASDGISSNPYKSIVEQYGLIDKLEFLTKSLNSCVFNMAVYILHTFFYEEDDLNDNEEINNEKVKSPNILSSIVNEVIDSIDAKNNTSSILDKNTNFCFDDSLSNNVLT